MTKEDINAELVHHINTAKFHRTRHANHVSIECLEKALNDAVAVELILDCCGSFKVTSDDAQVEAIANVVISKLRDAIAGTLAEYGIPTNYE